MRRLSKNEKARLGAISGVEYALSKRNDDELRFYLSMVQGLLERNPIDTVCLAGLYEAMQVRPIKCLYLLTTRKDKKAA